MRNSKKIIIIIAILIITLLISGGVFAYVYIATDIFKTDKQLFFKYFAQITSEDGFIDKRIEQFNTKKTETPYENSGEFTVDVEYPEESLNKIIDKVNELTIRFSGKADSINKKVERNIEVDYGDDVTFPVTYKQYGNKYGIQIEELSQQFIGIKNENLEQFLMNLYMANMIEEESLNGFNFQFVQTMQGRILGLTQTIKSASNVIDDIKFSEEEKSQLKQIYVNVIKDSILSENFSSVKNQSYTLELTAEEIKNVIIKMLETTKENSLIIDKINELILEQDSEYETIEVTVIDDIIESLNEAEISSVNNLKLTLLQDNKQLKQIIIQSGENQILIEKNKTTDGVIYNLNYDIEENIEENSIIEDESSAMQLNLYFNIQYSGLVDLSNIQENCKFGLNINSDENTMKYDYEINSNTEFKESVLIEDLSEEKTVFLNKREGNQVITFLTNLGNRIAEINKNQMEELGLEEDENPLIYSNPITALLVLTMSNLEESIEGTSSSLSEYEKQTFNQKFENYIGENKSSSEVNALLSRVFNHNMSQEDMTTMVKVVDKTNQNADINPNEDITNLPVRVSTDNKYKVTAIYSEEGYITEIEINIQN